MAHLPVITHQQLRSYGGSDELRVDSDGNNKEVNTRTASWGKRLIRFLSIPFRAPDKAQQYTEAKVVVREALIRAYGREIGTKAFEANIGEMISDRHVSSPYEPITGRKIHKMLDHAERELEQRHRQITPEQRQILEKYNKPEHGSVRLGTTWSTPTGTPEKGVPNNATRDWMLRKEAGLAGQSPDDPTNFTSRIERRSMNMRSREIPLGSPPPDDALRQVANPLEPPPEDVTMPRQVANAFLDDARLRLENETSDTFSWTFDFSVKTKEGDLVPSTIGLRVDRNHPGLVNVFDVNHCEVQVPQEELAEWLDAHFAVNYVGAEPRLFRSDVIMDPNFREEPDGQVHAQFNVGVDDKKFIETLQKNAELLKTTFGFERAPDGFNLRGSLKYDLNRLVIEIQTPDRDYAMGANNCLDALRALTHGGTWEEDRRAVLNLSGLLNQNLENTLSDEVNSAILKAMNVDNVLPEQPSSRLVLSRINDDTVRIEVESVHRFKWLASPNSGMDETDALDHRSIIRSSYTLEVPLTELRRLNGLDELKVTQGPTVSVDLVASREIEFGSELPSDLGMYRDRDRLVSEAFLSPTRDFPKYLAVCDGGRTVETVEGRPLDTAFVNSLGDERWTRTVDWGKGLDPQPLDQNELGILGAFSGEAMTKLSHILSPSTVTEFYNRTMRKALNDDEFAAGANMPPTHTTVIPIDLPNGKKAVDIEFRCQVPTELVEQAPNRILKYFDGPPQEPGRYEMTAKLRIPLEQLQDGGPEVFDMITPCRLERRPQQQ